MLVTLNDFRRNAEKDGLCNEFSQMWDSCTSKKQLMDMCLGSKGVDYLCDSIAKGWGISPELISQKFSNYINGRYIFDNGKYSSMLYCNHKGEIQVETTLVTAVKCDMTINVPKNAICKIYTTLSNLTLNGEGEAIVVHYGESSQIACLSSTLKFKEIHKKEKDTYE